MFLETNLERFTVIRCQLVDVYRFSIYIASTAYNGINVPLFYYFMIPVCYFLVVFDAPPVHISQFLVLKMQTYVAFVPVLVNVTFL